MAADLAAEVPAAAALEAADLPALVALETLAAAPAEDEVAAEDDAAEDDAAVDEPAAAEEPEAEAQVLVPAAMMTEAVNWVAPVASVTPTETFWPAVRSTVLRGGGEGLAPRRGGEAGPGGAGRGLGLRLTRSRWWRRWKLLRRAARGCCSGSSHQQPKLRPATKRMS